MTEARAKALANKNKYSGVSSSDVPRAATSSAFQPAASAASGSGLRERTADSDDDDAGNRQLTQCVILPSCLLSLSLTLAAPACC